MQDGIFLISENSLVENPGFGSQGRELESSFSGARRGFNPRSPDYKTGALGLSY